MNWRNGHLVLHRGSGMPPGLPCRAGESAETSDDAGADSRQGPRRAVPGQAPKGRSQQGERAPVSSRGSTQAHAGALLCADLLDRLASVVGFMRVTLVVAARVDSTALTPLAIDTVTAISIRTNYGWAAERVPGQQLHRGTSDVGVSVSDELR